MTLAGVIDTTARHESEREKEQQQRALERSNADLEEFAYTASHDLKAPMRPIATLAQWIAEEIEPTTNLETLDNLKLLRERVARLERLLEGLRAYSHIGHAQTPVEDVDVVEMAHELLQCWRRRPASSSPARGLCRRPLAAVTADVVVVSIRPYTAREVLPHRPRAWPTRHVWYHVS
jgi:light-regulated signal transduction histidine kinase (bacteriophytochrome)